jgi:hypothetical protein
MSLIHAVLRDTAPWVYVFGVAVLLLLAAALLAFLVPARRWPLVAVTATALLAVGSAVHAILRGGEILFEPAPEGAVLAMQFARGMVLQLHGALLVGALVYVALPVLGLLIGRWLRQGEPRPTLAWLTLLGATGLGLITLSVTFGWARDTIAAFSGVARMSSGDKLTFITAAFDDAWHGLDNGRRAVAILLPGLLAVTAVLALRARVVQNVSRRAFVLAGLWFAVGAAAFGATRSLASDAAHPLPLLPGPHFPPPVPTVTHCPAPPSEALHLRLGELPMLEGRPVRSPADLAAAIIVDHIELNARLSRPAPRALLIAAAPDQPASEVLAWIPSSLAAYGYAERPHSYTTRTRGEVKKPEPCAIPLAAGAATGSWQAYLSR